MFDNKGFTEIIRMLVIVSFIAVIYMTGIYIWQYVETHNRVAYVVDQLNKILEESIIKRESDIDFSFGSQGGCENIYIYNFNKERTSSMAISIDSEKLDLINNRKKFFDINTDGIDLKLYRGKFVGHLHCTDVSFDDAVDYEVLDVKSGQIGVVLENYDFVDQYIEDLDYQVKVILKDIIFIDNNGGEVYIGEHAFDSIELGWSPE